MIRFKLQRKLLAVGVLALALSGIGTAYGQNWTVTGKTAGGGNIVAGTAPITTPLNSTTPTATTLTSTGFDNITLNLGVTAGPFAGSDTIGIPYSNETLTNNGTVIGANAATAFDAISFKIAGAMSGETVINNGNSTGGNSSGAGVGGSGIFLRSFGAMSGISLTNNGNTTGGTTVTGTGGFGIFLRAFAGAISGVKLTNSGNATGGNATGSGLGGYGIFLQNDSATTMSNITLTNSGNATGGSSGAGGTGGKGISLRSFGAMSSVMLTNTGNAIGGNGDTGGGGPGILLASNSAMTNVTLFNSGNATGGNATGGGGNGIFLFSGGGSSNLAVTNFGSITGGSAAAGGTAGNGISSNTGKLTLNNWGAISAGSGLTPVAINLQSSSNNTVNLDGHSSVNGKISDHGAVDSNHLNLNFTGMSPAAIAALKAQLAAQGVLTGHDSTGTFTVRGVNYNYNPLVLSLNVSSYQLQGLTPNQAAIGASLDSAAINPAPGSPLFNLFNAIDLSGDVPGALEELSPQKYEIYGDLAIANASSMVQEIDQRMNNLRDGSESIDTSGIGGATVAGFTKDDGKTSKEIQPAAPAPNRWGFFATGNGLFFRGNSHDIDLQGGKADIAGTMAGVDAKVGDHGVIGALFAYDNADVTLGGDGSKATIESYSGGLYGAWHDGGFYTNGMAAYTRNNYKSERNILFPGAAATANGSTNGNQATVNLDGGYDWHVTDRLTLGPLAGVQYVHLDVDGFNESGFSASDLAVGSQDMDSLQSRLGGRVDYHLLTQPTASFAAELHAAWQHEFLNDSRGIGAAFSNTGPVPLAPFSVQTAAPLRDAAVVGAGLNFTFHNRLTLFADYELQIWQASYFEQTINGGCRISF